MLGLFSRSSLSIFFLKARYALGVVVDASLIQGDCFLLVSAMLLQTPDIFSSFLNLKLLN